MKYFLTICTILFAVAISFESAAQVSQEENIITAEELQNLIGDWEGNLTYLNYSDNKPFSMPANLKIEQGKNENQLVLFNIYPNEPKANSKGKIAISKDGKEINNEPIVSRKRLTDGQLEIITQYSGKDARKKAKIRMIYSISDSNFSTKKEVQFENSTEWIRRNEFSYSK